VAIRCSPYFGSGSALLVLLDALSNLLPNVSGKDRKKTRSQISRQVVIDTKNRGVDTTHKISFNLKMPC
jgi:hypothetical protein